MPMVIGRRLNTSGCWFSQCSTYTQHTPTLDFLPAGRDMAEKYVKRLFLWINYNRRFIADSIKLFSKREAMEIQLPSKVTKISLAA